MGHFIFGSVAFRVTLEMPEIAVGTHFNKRGAITAPGTRNRRGHGFKHCYCVVVRHADAGYAVTRCAVSHPLHRGGFGLGHRNRPLVVLAHKYHRQLPHRCQIQGLMESTLIGRALAKEGDRHPVLAHFFRRQCSAASNRHARADDAAATEFVRVVKQMHMPALAFAQAGHLAKHLSRHGVQRHAFGNRKMVRPMRAHHRVIVTQMRADAHGDWLLSGGQMHLARHRPTADVKGQTFLNRGR